MRANDRGRWSLLGVSTNAMVFIINLVRSSEVSALFYVYRADPFITGRLSCSSVCVFYPNRRGKDRCVRLFALLGDMPFSLRRVPLASFGAVERSSGKSLLRLPIFRGSIYLGARHRTRDKRKAVVAHFIQNTLTGISDQLPISYTGGAGRNSHADCWTKVKGGVHT
jgi:hypothetical protein